MDMLRHAHTPKDHPRLCGGKIARHSADIGGGNACQLFHFLGGKAGQMLFFCLPVLSIAFDIGLVIQPLFDDHRHDGIQQCHIRARAELQHMFGMAPHRGAARIHDNQLAAAFGKLLEIGGCNGVVFCGVGPNHDGHISVFDLVKRGRHRARAHVFHQRRHRRGMAQTRAVIDVVMPKTLADQLLEQIRLFIGAFGTAKPRNRAPAMLAAQIGQPIGCEIQRLFPAGFAEMGKRVCRVYV